MKKYWKNIKYIFRHKWYVYQECRKLKVGLWQSIVHDWTKFGWLEFSAYADYFYSESDIPCYNRLPRVEGNFNRAWLHHIHHGPHHWQHWILRLDSGETIALEMPEKYVREMVADWRGVGRSLGKGPENSKIWYGKVKDVTILHPKTRELFEKLLNQ